MRLDIADVRLEIEDPDLKKIFQDMMISVGGFRLVESGDSETPSDLFIFELGTEIDKDLNYVHSLLEEGIVDDALLTGSNPSSEILLRAIKMGVREFFFKPIDENDLRQSLEKIRIQKENSHTGGTSKKNGSVIYVMGAKGGAGATTVAVNLAAALTRADSSPAVALLDLNILFGEVPFFLEIKPAYHWGELIDNIDRLDSTYLMNILCKHSSGIHVLTSPRYLNGNASATPEAMSRIIALMREMFDYIIIDGTRSLDKISLSLMEKADDLLLISLLSLPCLRNTGRLQKTLGDLGYFTKDKVKVVINRYLKKSDISLDDAETAIDNRIFMTIPNDYRTALSAINQGRILARINSRAPITRSINRLVDLLLQKETSHTKKPWEFLKSWYAR